MGLEEVLRSLDLDQAALTDLDEAGGGRALVHAVRGAPIDADVCAVDVAGPLAGEEGHELAHIFGFRPCHGARPVFMATHLDWWSMHERVTACLVL